MTPRKVSIERSVNQAELVDFTRTKIDIELSFGRTSLASRLLILCLGANFQRSTCRPRLFYYPPEHDLLKAIANGTWPYARPWNDLDGSTESASNPGLTYRDSANVRIPDNFNSSGGWEAGRWVRQEDAILFSSSNSSL